ncbi:MAG: YihY/virulence factor BrkB family protein [Eubacteriales bacterium]
MVIKMFKKMILTGQEFGRQLTKDNINAYAASTAFFIFLSFMPMLLFLCSIIPFTPLTKSDLMEAVITAMPDSLDSLMIALIEDVYRQSIGLVSTTAIATIWSAGKGMLALMKGLNVVNDVIENRNYIVLRFIASGYTIMLLLTMIFTLLLSVFGMVLVDGIEEMIPVIIPAIEVIMEFRIVFSVFVLTMVFTLVFTYIPNKKIKMREQIVGAFFSAVAWNVFSFGFSVYIMHFNAFSAYGSLGTVVIAMLWLYFCMYLMLIGANVNKYFKPIFHLLFEK